MFIRKKKNRSGTTSIVVVEKINGRFKEHQTIGISSNEKEIEYYVGIGKKWIKSHQRRLYPELDLFEEESRQMEHERQSIQAFISQIDNILINGTQLILDKVFDKIGFDCIDEDVNLSKIYRYLDKLNQVQKNIVEHVSVMHTQKILGGNIGVMFYDVTTLYFEADYEDELRKTGFSKEGRHSNPQIILGLLVSLSGYPLAYSIHEGNKYEGHTMLPIVNEFVKRYNLSDFVVVADSGLMTDSNITELENLGYKYIIGARIKNESKEVKKWILSQKKIVTTGRKGLGDLKKLINGV